MKGVRGDEMNCNRSQGKIKWLRWLKLMRCAEDDKSRMGYLAFEIACTLVLAKNLLQTFELCGEEEEQLG